MHRLAVVAIVFFVAGSTAAGTTRSGLYGFVRRGPIVPVCVAEQPCDGPARSFPLVFWRNGRIAGRTTTSTTGSYRIRLAPGLYRVSSLGRPTIGSSPEPRSARVFSGRFRRIDFFVDTGIR
jgi:hypothetical protein